MKAHIADELVSIHAPLARSNRRRTGSVISIRSFNTCSSCEEQLSRVSVIPVTDMFQYMLLLRGATSLWTFRIRQRLFQYMLLLRGATETMQLRSSGRTFQYMLLLRGATHHSIPAVLPPDVSIHAPLARSNSRAPAGRAALRCFNTCSSCEEQLRTDARLSFCLGFQYMLLLRGATRLGDYVTPAETVSIHAPLARSKSRVVLFGLYSIRFNTCSSCEEQLVNGYLEKVTMGFNTCSSCVFILV